MARKKTAKTRAPWADEVGETLLVRVTPKASAERIAPERDETGALVLRVAVTAAPEDGKANAAVIALLAEALGLPRSALAIVRGETARTKTIRVAHRR
ncbi:DUF167 domain-containing protein [Salinarimonas ramus]|uniref:UPF0235 protein GCM10011322_08860 n=1 Tax=Salinarimonas ramus TaxID=690164 RepID=A0A917V2M9_9HYPH|nr:DUF167 domain-containing protein [Salinarimonas ramus]GGK24454.1 UPF0235 protein [Salinarimonas ramus]